MSLFSTIAHRDAPQLRGVSPRGIGTMALVLAAGMALGYAISNIDATTETPVVVADIGLAHGEFLRINTTALEWMEPVIPSVTQPDPALAVDHFAEANVDSYVWLSQAIVDKYAVETAFETVNTDMPAYGPQPDNTIPFMAMNVGSYEALIEIWEGRHEVDPGFWETNTNLVPTYTEPQSGPR